MVEQLCKVEKVGYVDLWDSFVGKDEMYVRDGLHVFLDLTRFNKIVIQETPQMAVDKEARAYRESTHIVILSVPCPYTKYKGQSIDINVHRNLNNVRKGEGVNALFGFYF